MVATSRLVWLTSDRKYFPIGINCPSFCWSAAFTMLFDIVTECATNLHCIAWTLHVQHNANLFVQYWSNSISEEYVETFRSFSGAGATLGGNNDSAVSGNTVDPSTLADPTATDTSRPTTSIQVRLPNGQRKVIKINLDATVLQLASHMKPLLGSDATPFRLVSGFPPKPLEDFALTVEAAGLKGAQVQVQKA